MSSLVALPGPALDRFVKLAGMLGSAHDGEIVNAARAASKLLQQHGMTWRDAMMPPASATLWPRPSSAPSPMPVKPLKAWERSVLLCRSFPGLFNDWERSFLDDIMGRSSVSPKQMTIIDRLKAKADRHLDGTEDRP